MLTLTLSEEEKELDTFLEDVVIPAFSKGGALENAFCSDVIEQRCIKINSYGLLNISVDGNVEVCSETCQKAEVLIHDFIIKENHDIGTKISLMVTYRYDYDNESKPVFVVVCSLRNTW